MVASSSRDACETRARVATARTRAHARSRTTTTTRACRDGDASVCGRDGSDKWDGDGGEGRAARRVERVNAYKLRLQTNNGE